MAEPDPDELANRIELEGLDVAAIEAESIPMSSLPDRICRCDHHPISHAGTVGRCLVVNCRCAGFSTRSTGQAKRSRIRQISEHRRDVNRRRREALEAKFGPKRGWRCQLAKYFGTPCWGPVDGHEILSRSRAGQTDENLLDVDGIVTACRKHNRDVDLQSELAHQLGLTKHSWEA